MLIINLPLSIFSSIAALPIAILLFLLVSVWALAILIIAKMFSGNSDRHLYPEIEEIEQASDDKITFWMINLPAASTEKELEVINKIARKYIEVKKAEKPNELSSKYRYAVAQQMQQEIVKPYEML